MKRQGAVRSILVFVALTALGFAVKAPFAADRFRLYPDAIAYVNIARNLAAGEGYVSTLKTSYFLPYPARHCALPDWPPIYPLFAGAMMRLGASEVGLQVVNAFLASLAAGLVFLVGERLFDRRSALLAGVFAAVAVGLFRTGTTAMSDPLGLVLALGALLAVLHAEGQRGWLVAAGALAGLGALARYPNVVLLPAMLGYVLAGKDRQARAASVATGFVVVAAPFLASKWVLCGSPLYSVQAFHYCTSSFSQSAWTWPLTESPVTALSYLSAAWTNTRYLAVYLFRTSAGLQFMAVGLVALLAGRVRSRHAAPSPRLEVRGWRSEVRREGARPAGRGLLVAVAVMNFGVYAFTPSLPAAQGVRFMLLTWCLLVPFCAEGIVALAGSKSASMRVAAIATCVAALFVCVKAYFSPMAEAMELKPLDARVVRWIDSSLAPGTVVASNNPWLVAHETGWPACSLPHGLDAAGLRRFMSEYGVGAILVLDSRHESRTAAAIRARRGGFRVVQLGCGFAGVPIRPIGGSASAAGVTRDRAPGPRRGG